MEWSGRQMKTSFVLPPSALSLVSAAFQPLAATRTTRRMPSKGHRHGHAVAAGATQGSGGDNSRGHGDGTGRGPGVSDGGTMPGEHVENPRERMR